MLGERVKTPDRTNTFPSPGKGREKQEAKASIIKGKRNGTA